MVEFEVPIYLKWCESKRSFVEEDVLGRTYGKSCLQVHYQRFTFHPNGSLTEYRLFDRFETQGPLVAEKRVAAS